MYYQQTTRADMRGDGTLLIGGDTVSSFSVDSVNLDAPGFDANSFWLLLGPNDGALSGTTYTSTGSNQLTGAAFGPDDTVYVGGNYSEPLSIGGETLTTPDSSSAYWARQPITP